MKTGCVTTLAGELLSVITNNTILANALNNSFVERVNEELIIQGARYSEKVGLNRACFTVRILDQFIKLTVNEKANFLLAAVFITDLNAIKNSSALKKAFEILIKNDEYFKGCIKVVDDELMKDMAGFGAITIAKAKGLV